MDQLHEELKEPIVAETRDLDTNDMDDKREGDRSPSEDEFLSCDSSSDRGEGDGQGRMGGMNSSLAETELLIQDEAGRGISEKERMKDRKFSCGHRRNNSEQVDEDADVDTTMMPVDDRASPETLPPPRPASPCRTPGMNIASLLHHVRKQCHLSILGHAYCGNAEQACYVPFLFLASKVSAARIGELPPSHLAPLLSL